MQDTVLQRIRLESILAAAIVSIVAVPDVGQELNEESEQSLILKDVQIGLQLKKTPDMEFDTIEQRLRKQLIPYFSTESRKRIEVLQHGGAKTILIQAKQKLKQKENLSIYEKAALDLFMLERSNSISSA
ncbi:hypothetical protein [Bdellovibrio sp. BCCA]|uniref:hypothetical protein n=1 Tax=Bdellovibrio sp. BCCA TaxID=3136281 RepID=UPI0030F0F7A1